jgi:DNA-directed RNA polymerase subunit RPC12/RpoP
MLSAMMLTCPRCGEKAEDLPSTEITCRSCSHRWLRPLPVPMSYLLRRVDGEEPTGPFTHSELRELLYTKALTGREKVRVPGHDVPWALLSEQAPLQDVIRLLDIQTQRTGGIQGWQVKPPEKAAVGAAVDSEPLPLPAEVLYDLDEPRGIPKVVVVVGVVVLVLVIAAVVATIT